LEEHAVVARHLAGRSYSDDEATRRYREAAEEAAETARMLAGRMRGRSADVVPPKER
jgi:hypothetical protein